MANSTSRTNTSPHSPLSRVAPDYEESFLPSGVMGGSPEEALDCVCGLYLGDPSGVDL